MSTTADLERISMALLAQAGIDPSNVRAVSYHHRVGEYPTLEVECYAHPGDEIDIESRMYEWRPKETA